MDPIDQAFPGAPDLQSRVRHAQNLSQDTRSLLDDIVAFITTKTIFPTDASGSTTKKRKLEDAPNGIQNKAGQEAWGTGLAATINDISFSVPVRKKLRLEIGSQAQQGVRAASMQTGDVEVEVRWRELGKSILL